nr:hypothetical protein Itr_chr12CG08570 [Ipomoea trifida]
MANSVTTLLENGHGRVANPLTPAGFPPNHPTAAPSIPKRRRPHPRLNVYIRWLLLPYSSDADHTPGSTYRSDGPPTHDS